MDRLERDTLGEIAVPADKYWGAQTERSRRNFVIGGEKMPLPLIRALAIVKKASALANLELGVIDEEKAKYIALAADEIIDGKLDENFPLVVWQTGSGTQTNMNVNEVIAHRGNELAGKNLLHPNDDVNKSQSSNDTFPTAMHVSAVLAIEGALIPAAKTLVASLKKLERRYKNLVKCGRTHLQDAVPLTFGDEIGGWRSMVETAINAVKASEKGLRELALGGTAVGTGLNAPVGFDSLAAEKITAITGEEFVTAKNKFQALAAKDALAFSHGAIKTLACNLMKIANDVRWLASGPRLGLGEITIPANEPGSSIMPGKVNPTQCEAVTMVAVQVQANDVAVSLGASQGNFELNVYMPVVIYDYLQSVRLLSDVMISFEKNCVRGIKANEDKMQANLSNSLMLVTALNTYIGYENAAKVAKKAYAENVTLKEACVSLGFLTAEKFDEVFHPEEMAKKK